MRGVVLIAGIGTACGPQAEAPTVTWTEVAPVIDEHCSACHVEGGAGFALDGYEQASVVAPALADVVARGEMPPWGAVETETCAPKLPFTGDLGLPDDQAALVMAWADQGAPGGQAPERAPKPVETGPTPDVVWQVVAPYEADTPDAVVCHALGEPLAEGRWLEAVQFTPADAERTHHATLLTVPPGSPTPRGWRSCYGAVGEDSPLVFWAPGTGVFQAPDDAAIWVPAGTAFVLQTHFAFDGAPEPVMAPEVGLTWADEVPTWRAGLAILGNARDASEGLQPGPADRDGAELRIPAGAKAHTETMRLPVPGAPGRKMWAVGHHMHLLGSAMTTRFVGAHDDACLLSTPAWDPDWQRLYRIDARRERLPPLREGDTLEVTCTYDNHLGHAGTRDLLGLTGASEPFDVVLGGTSRDEMCAVLVGWMEPVVAD